MQNVAKFPGSKFAYDSSFVPCVFIQILLRSIASNLSDINELFCNISIITRVLILLTLQKQIFISVGGLFSSLNILLILLHQFLLSFGLYRIIFKTTGFLQAWNKKSYRSEILHNSRVFSKSLFIWLIKNKLILNSIKKVQTYQFNRL